MALARAYGNTAGHRRPRYAVEADRAAARTGGSDPAQYRRAVDDDEQRPSWLVAPRARNDDPEARAAETRPRYAPEPRYEEFAPRGRNAERLDDLDARFDVLESHYEEPTRDRRARRGESQPEQPARATARTLDDRGPQAKTPAVAEDTDRPPAEAVAGNRLLTILLFVAGLATSVALWVFDTQPGAINDSATLLIAAGRITGLIGGYLLFIQLLMMSRVSWLEEWVGARDLLRWHRWLGTSLLVFVMAHIVFIVFGYALQSDTPVVTQTWTVITTFEDMISATVATGLLVAVGLLAIRQVRKRLPYELWHLLHLTGYAVLLLGYGHQVAVGADLSGRFASVFWPGLGALVIAALVWGRVVEPLHLNLRHRFEVADVVEESDDAYSVYISGRQLDRLPAQAGQFMRWRFLNRDGWWQSHPFSLSAAPNAQWLRLTVTAVGTHTDRLGEIEPGTKVWAEGPFGTFTAERRTRRKALLIAGGSGIAPIRALLEEMPSDTIVIYRARTAEDLVFRDELDALAKRRGHQVRYVVGGRDEPGPRRLFSAEGMQKIVPDVHRRDVYLCGPPGLVDATVDILRDLEVPAGQMHLDPFEF